MRKRGELIALLALVVLMVAMASLSLKHDDDASRAASGVAVRSSYRTFPAGYKALYLTLQELGYPVHRQNRPYALLPKQGLLIVADPYRTLPTEYEGQQLMRWIGQGNYALILVEHHEEYLKALAGEYASQKTKTSFKDDDDAPSDAPPVIEEDADLTVQGKMPFTVEAPRVTAQAIDNAKLKKAVPHAVYAQLTALTAVAPTLEICSDLEEIPVAAVQSLVGDATPLYHSEDGVVAAYSQIGAGGIVWCSSPWSFSNEGLPEGKNLDLLLALAEKRPGGPVIFDEYHHGYGTGISLWTLAPPQTKLGILQAGLAVLLLFGLLAWRFGPHRLPAEERFTRSRAEYLTSMAALLQRARATHLVRDRLAFLLRRELARRLGLPPTASPAQLLAANQRTPAVEHAALERVLHHLHALESHPRPEQDALFRLSAEVHRLLQRRN